MSKTKFFSSKKAGKQTGNQASPKAPAEKVFSHLYQIIANHPLFEGLSIRQWELLANLAMETQFAPGAYLFRRQDPANRFYLILDGRVELELASTRDGMRLVQMAGPGDYVGWAWMFEPYSFYLSARTVDPTKAIFFYGTILRQYCEEDHDLGYEIVKRVAATALQRLAVFQKNFQERTALKPKQNPLPVLNRNEDVSLRKQTRI
jgi:CRP-like cAMP-binding protein